MKLNKNLVLSLCLMVVIASVYRVLPNRPFGFAPQIAMALFGGAFFVKNKKWAFSLPLISMFISDLVYQVLYNYGYTEISGFYNGQWVNYLLIGGLTVFGFLISDAKITKVILATIAAPTTYFLISNGMVWLGNGGYQRPRTFSGLIQCLVDGVPFYQNSVMGTIVFGAILFGGYALLKKGTSEQKQAA
ncbi:MAG: hypothetical protein K2Q21_03340 [Chitinophagaceae bacterium]|nr:hypothetical protein [Chitinophagaceae bacterium]